MSDNSAIEWTDATWNPITGCTKVSPGCDNCYAETFAERFRGTPGHHFEQGFDMVLRPERLDEPLKWRKPRRVFVNSMSDLFHKDIPDDFIARVFAVMAMAPQHTFQVLTKRHGRMNSLLNSKEFRNLLAAVVPMYGANDPDLAQDYILSTWPLPNVWLGVSVENQQWAGIRIPALRETPAAVRMLSCEPLLGPVEDLDLTGIGWVIVGGESGRGARPMHLDWARGIRDACTAAGVPFFFKQWGEFVPAKVFDHPGFVGGRMFNDPRGGSTAPVIREPGPSGTMRTATTRLMEPGDRTRGAVMLDNDTIAVRVGKGNAGRELDGRTWDEYPAEVTR